MPNGGHSAKRMPLDAVRPLPIFAKCLPLPSARHSAKTAFAECHILPSVALGKAGLCRVPEIWHSANNVFPVVTVIHHRPKCHRFTNGQSESSKLMCGFFREHLICAFAISFLKSIYVPHTLLNAVEDISAKVNVLCIDAKLLYSQRHSY